MNLRSRLTELVNKGMNLPFYSSPDDSRNAGIFQYFLLIILLITIPIGFILARTSETPIKSSMVVPSLNLLVFICLAMTRMGKYKAALHLFPYSIWLILTLSAVFVFGEIGSPPIDSYILVILAAGLFLGWRHGLALVLLSLVSILGISVLSLAGGEPSPLEIKTAVRNFLFYLSIYFLTAALVHFTTDRIQKSLKRAELHEKELEERNQELEQLHQSLEERVEARTNEISRQKNFLQTLVDITPIAIVSLDSESKIVAWNPAFEGMFGFAPEELDDQNIDGLITNPTTRLEAERLTTTVAAGNGIREVAVR